MSTSKADFIEWLVAKKRNRQQYEDAFDEVPSSAFESIMEDLPVDSDRAVHAQSESNFLKVEQFLKEAADSIRQVSVPDPVLSVESNVWETLVKKAQESNFAFARSAREGIRCRADLGRILKQMLTMKNRNDYPAALVKLGLSDNKATAIIKFASRCETYPKFLNIGLGYTGLRDMLPKIVRYFKSVSASVDAQSPLSGLYWKEQGVNVRLSPNSTSATILPITPPPSIPVGRSLRPRS
jgi:hypothetical protein